MQVHKLLFSSILILLITNNSFTQSLPEPRWGHTLVYNQSNQTILLFGGADKKGGQSYKGDTWIFSDNSWERLAIDGPDPRGFAAATFHQERQTIILHGGRGNGNKTFSDLWEWNGIRWTQIDTSSVYPADHHQMVYLKKEHKLMAYGGWIGSGVTDEMWFWDGQWKKLESIKPPKRAAFGMAHDALLNKTILFGGLWINGQYADLWEFQDNHWKQIGGPYDNSSLDHHNMIYDPIRKVVVGFGGKNYRYALQGKTFTIDNGTITTLPDEGPLARHSFGMTFSDQTGLVYLFGGKVYEGEEQTPLNDFWTWDGERWVQIN